MEERSLCAIITEYMIIFLLHKQPVRESEGLDPDRCAVVLATAPFHSWIYCIQIKLAFPGLPLKLCLISLVTTQHWKHKADIININFSLLLI